MHLSRRISRCGTLLVGSVRAILHALARPCIGLARQIEYRCLLLTGHSAGRQRFVPGSAPRSLSGDRGPFLIDVLVPGTGDSAIRPEQAEQWRARQTMPELRVMGLDNEGLVLWQSPAEPEGESQPELTMSTRSPWFAAPGCLPELDATHLESCFLVAAAEQVDATVIQSMVARDDGPEAPERFAARSTAADAIARLGSSLRRNALFSSSAFELDCRSGKVVPTRSKVLAKIVDEQLAVDTGQACNDRFRRGQYLSSVALGPVLDVGINDAARFPRGPRPIREDGDGAKGRQSPVEPADRRAPLLVLNSFLARGGAEHTLFETLRALKGRFETTIVTLAPHRPELGDRRPDFLEITERIYCLGDLVHPDAMLGQVLSLIDSLGVEIIYNANGTTIFYDLAPSLRRARPGLRIIDHLYDHRVGYIDRYSPALLGSIDACVAENHRIAETLEQDHGWPASRAPVIWPCGRSDDELVAPERRAGLRSRLRQELGLAESDIVILTAARMHQQKRPLDLVRLAQRVADIEQIAFLIVGGGELEHEVDEAIRGAGRARIRRLGFRTDIPDLIIASDIGCLVSGYEGLPVFLLECLQAGRPFLGTRVGDLGLVIDRTGAGVAVDRPGDLDSLEAAARRLADPSTWQQMAARAEAAGSELSVTACAERYARVFLGQPVGCQLTVGEPTAGPDRG